MKRLTPRTSLVVLFISVAVLSVSSAQQPSELSRHLIRVMGPRFLVFRNDVAQDLKLSREQQQQLAKLRQSELGTFRKLMGELQKSKPQERAQKMQAHRQQANQRLNEALKKLLNAKQQHRLFQIELQHQGMLAIARPGVAKKLKVNEEQRKKVFQVVKDMQKGFQELQKTIQKNSDPKVIQQKAQQIQKDSRARIQALLTKEQLQQWQELVGTPLKKANPPRKKPGSSSLPKPPIKKSSLAELQAEIQSLKPTQVPWRTISWRVSLVEGIKESRQSKKPILMWVFIDRPIDDERC